MRDVTLAVVTALSPSPTTLSEYGLHLLRALGRKRGLRVVALVEDRPDADYPDIPGVEIVPAWRFDSLSNPLRIARAARRVGADVVLFNAHFTSFGARKVPATLGLLTPLVVRGSGSRSITLLHNIVETVDLGAAGFGASPLMERLLRTVGSVVTWLVLRSNLVTTTMPAYVDVLRSKYRATNVALTPHGAFELPAPPRPPTHRTRVMTFGKFGTYKRVEVVIEALGLLDRPEVELVVAGTDSPNTPGYLAEVERGMADPSGVRFTGYVAEEDVEAVFRDAALTVFPYTATTGSSGVLHQAGSYGCTPVLPRIGDLEGLIREEGFDGVFFEPGDPVDLARAIASVLDDDVRRAAIAAHNHRAASGLPIDDVADWYLVHIARLAGRAPTALLQSTARDTEVDGAL
ncbi:MAG: glycosyltransferase [Acidimicrobiia bacterium]|nr:glycosyltransferase [Acidimicrobiia bacterium]